MIGLLIMQKFHISSMLCLWLSPLTSWVEECPKFPVVDLGYAKHEPTVINTTTANNISYATYANIRFAQPPVGDLRFRKPKIPPPANTTVQTGIYPRNATDCPISIIPGLSIGPGLEGVTWGNEDCLFLDVKVPEGLNGAKVPVLHWLHGGGYAFGSKQAWAGEVAALFQTMGPDQKFIAVASNYRLGALGWMSPEVEGIDKNVGLWDGLVALEWTKEYISYFGGDPDDITVIGESAGGGIAQALITAWGGEKGAVPFNKAILTSPGYRPLRHRAAADMASIYNHFLNVTRCADVACLRSKSSKEIIAANRDLYFNVPTSGWLAPETGYGPIIDGDIVPDLPDRLLLQGKYQKTVKKVLTANMVGDGEYLNTLPAETWKNKLSFFMKNVTEDTIFKVSKAYPSNLTIAFNQFGGDAVFVCHAYLTARAFGTDAWRYRMTIPPGTHGQDQLYYLYTGMVENGLVEFPEIAMELQDYFRTFIFEGGTGGDGCKRPHWPSFGIGQRWMNITSDGFQLVAGEDNQAERCHLVLELLDDPANGW